METYILTAVLVNGEELWWEGRAGDDLDLLKLEDPPGYDSVFVHVYLCRKILALRLSSPEAETEIRILVQVIHWESELWKNSWRSEGSRTEPGKKLNKDVVAKVAWFHKEHMVGKAPEGYSFWCQRAGLFTPISVVSGSWPPKSENVTSQVFAGEVAPIGPGRFSREGHSCEPLAAKLTAAGRWDPDKSSQEPRLSTTISYGKPCHVPPENKLRLEHGHIFEMRKRN